MKDLSLRQKQLLAEFLSQLSVGLILVGGIGAFLDYKLSFEQKIIQFIFYSIFGIIFLVISLIILRK